MDGRYCTIIDGTETYYRPGNGEPPKSSFIAESCVFGYEEESLLDEHTSTFASMILRFDNLEEFLGYASFRLSENRDTSGRSNLLEQLRFVPYEPPGFPIPSIASTLSFRTSQGGTHGIREIVLRDVAHIDVSFEKPKPIHECLRITRTLRDFFAFLSAEPVYTSSLVVNRDGTNHGWPHLSVSFREPGTIARNPIMERRLIQTVDGAGTDLPSVIDRWFTLVDEYKPLYQALMATIYEPSPYLEVDFLRAAQAIEAFHRKDQGGTYLTPEEFEAFTECAKNGIPSSALKATKQALSKKLTYFNEYSLRKRLKELLKYVGPEIRDLIAQNVSQFAAEIVDTRNFLTHHSREDKAKILRGQDLYKAKLKLVALSFVLVLRKLGVESWASKKALTRPMLLRPLDP